jgi:uncharacterized protein YeaO (DUF488 family)
MHISIKRIYDNSPGDGGIRLLVDGVWPRGVSKEQARLYHWWRDVAPSTELRKWFGHDVDKWEEFRQKYWSELLGKKESILKFLNTLDTNQGIVLLYGAKDENHNQAVVLHSFLRSIQSQ